MYRIKNYYDDILEYNVLMDVKDKNVETVKKEVERYHLNNFILTADHNALTKYEELFSITASADESLEFRRERVLNRYRMRAPFSLNFLITTLDNLIGKNKYNLEIDYNRYTIHLELDITDAYKFKEVMITLKKIIPANMLYISVPVMRESIRLKESAEVYEAIRFKIAKKVKKRFAVGSSKIGVDPLVAYEFAGSTEGYGRVGIDPLVRKKNEREVVLS